MTPPEFPIIAWKIEDTVVIEHEASCLFYVVAIYNDYSPNWPKGTKWRGGITAEGMRWCQEHLSGRVVVGSVPRGQDDLMRWPVIGFEKTVDAVRFKLTCL